MRTPETDSIGLEAVPSSRQILCQKGEGSEVGTLQSMILYPSL